MPVAHFTGSGLAGTAAGKSPDPPPTLEPPLEQDGPTVRAGPAQSLGESFGRTWQPENRRPR